MSKCIGVFKLSSLHQSQYVVFKNMIFVNLTIYTVQLCKQVCNPLIF